MNKFKVGDKVKIKYSDSFTPDIKNMMEKTNIFTIKECALNNRYILEEFTTHYAFLEDCLELINNNKNMNLIEKYKLTLKGEPEKTLIKTGIMSSEEILTSDGKDLFFEWLFQQNKKQFTDEVASKILKEEEKENKN